jgi:hypothetical protein
MNFTSFREKKNWVLTECKEKNDEGLISLPSVSEYSIEPISIEELGACNPQKINIVLYKDKVAKITIILPPNCRDLYYDLLKQKFGSPDMKEVVIGHKIKGARVGDKIIRYPVSKTKKVPTNRWTKGSFIVEIRKSTITIIDEVLYKSIQKKKKEEYRNTIKRISEKI